MEQLTTDKSAMRAETVLHANTATTSVEGQIRNTKTGENFKLTEFADGLSKCKEVDYVFAVYSNQSEDSLVMSTSDLTSHKGFVNDCVIKFISDCVMFHNFKTHAAVFNLIVDAVEAWNGKKTDGKEVSHE